ncbi:hypothetical protein ACIP5Y_22775 [Nocardia sp. NPDC088792]|uniref:hypothetical protein n=1 Tax=Nocardia sp. NPDC088792 TaxID=3364332 RepID=UPI0037F4220B
MRVRLQYEILLGAAATWLVGVVLSVWSVAHLDPHAVGPAKGAMVCLGWVLPVGLIAAWAAVAAGVRATARVRWAATATGLVALAAAATPPLAAHAVLHADKYRDWAVPAHAWFGSPDQLPVPHSVGYVVLCAAQAPLLLVALIQTAVTARVLLTGVRSAPVTRRRMVSGVALLMVGAAVAAGVMVAVRPVGALTEIRTAAARNLPIDTVPRLDIARTQRWHGPKLSGAQSDPAGVHGWIESGDRVRATATLAGFDPLTGARRWSIMRPGLDLGDGGDPRGAANYSADLGLVTWVRWHAMDPAVIETVDTDTGTPLRRMDAGHIGQKWFGYADPTGSEVSAFLHEDLRTGKLLWSIDPVSLGCPGRVGAQLAAMDDATLFSCPTTAGTDDLGADYLVGGLDERTGSVLWKRRIQGSRYVTTDLHGDAVVVQLQGLQSQLTIDARTGTDLGTAPLCDLKDSLAGGNCLTNDHDDTMILRGPDGTIRWRLSGFGDEWRRRVLATADTVLTIVTTDGPGTGPCWLVAYDLASGKRTVVAGPQPLAGQSPVITMPVPDAPLYPQSWGVLIGSGDELAVIPAR